MSNDTDQQRDSIKLNLCVDYKLAHPSSTLTAPLLSEYEVINDLPPQPSSKLVNSAQHEFSGIIYFVVVIAS